MSRCSTPLFLPNTRSFTSFSLASADLLRKKREHAFPFFLSLPKTK
jgi:hypothetical protein